jgi:DNA-binding NarL/FixJ family response regulator
VRLTRSAHPNVVVMDLRMPRMDGIQATREIKASMPATEVVVLSAFSEDQEVVQALQAGARAYLVKHDDPEEMLRAVRLASSGKLYLGASLAKTVLPRLVAPPPRDSGPASHRPPPGELTLREQDILRLIGRGKKAREVAGLLQISERTVRNHLRNIFAKLRVSSRAEAIVQAVRMGLIKL